MKQLPFNIVTAGLDAASRKAIIEALWSGIAEIVDEPTRAKIRVVPDREPVDGEHVFYVSFPGATRDHIPTQHFMVGARDERTAIMRAHERYVLKPRRRKGSSLRVVVGKPPSLLGIR